MPECPSRERRAADWHRNDSPTAERSLTESAGSDRALQARRSATRRRTARMTFGSTHPEADMTDLATFEGLVPLDHGLSVVVTRRAYPTPHTTVVNAGVLPHPVTGDQTVAFVAAGGTANSPICAPTRCPPRDQRRAAPAPASRDLRRSRGDPRQLGRLRPGDARRAAHRRPCRSHSHLLKPDMSSAPGNARG